MGERRFTPMISSASPSDGAHPGRLANRWILKRDCAVHRTESIAGFLIRAVPVRNKHWKIMKWCGTATDIEDR